MTSNTVIARPPRAAAPTQYSTGRSSAWQSACFGSRKSLVQIQSPRVSWTEGRSARTSNGFFLSRQRATSLRARFKANSPRIPRLSSIFEPSHASAACWLQSNKVRATSPRPSVASPHASRAVPASPCWAPGASSVSGSGGRFGGDSERPRDRACEAWSDPPGTSARKAY